MFAVALPVAPLLALANNLLEFRSDALKMIYVARRIPSAPATGIGTWAGAIRVLSYLGLATNCGCLALTPDFVSSLLHATPSHHCMACFGPTGGQST